MEESGKKEKGWKMQREERKRPDVEKESSRKKLEAIKRLSLESTSGSGD
jgi:hypothetical protein